MENRLAVEVEGLTKVFGATLALDAVDLRAARGEVVALLGPNGAGKTTLLKLLSTALKPTAGGGRILGEDLVKGRDTIRRRIGMISHNHHLYEELTAEENLRFAATMRGSAGARPIRKVRVEVGLETHGWKVRTYSTGTAPVVIGKMLCSIRACLTSPTRWTRLLSRCSTLRGFGYARWVGHRGDAQPEPGVRHGGSVRAHARGRRHTTH
jgi:ABC-type sugar transport system ATPase subunit